MLYCAQAVYASRNRPLTSCALSPSQVKKDKKIAQQRINAPGRLHFKPIHKEKMEYTDNNAPDQEGQAIDADNSETAHNQLETVPTDVTTPQDFDAMLGLLPTASTPIRNSYPDLEKALQDSIATSAKLDAKNGITKTQTLDVPTDDEMNDAILEHVTSNEALHNIRKSTFSDKSEEFWLGNGRLFNSSTRIHDNVWNGNLGQAVTAAAFLTTCTRRDWVIRREFKNVDHPVPGMFSILSGKTGDGKSPVIGSVSFIKRALSLIDEDREILRSRLYAELVAAAKNEDPNEIGKTYVNHAMKMVKVNVVSGNVTMAMLMKKLYAQHYYSVQASKLGGIYSELHARCTLLFSTEGGVMLNRILGKGSFGADDSPIMNAIHSGEPITHERSTDDVSLTINDPRLGILWGIQPHYMLAMYEAEAGDNGENNGHGLRYAVVNIHNTDKTNDDILGVDHSDPDAEKMSNPADIVDARFQMEKIMEGFALSQYDYIVFAPDAAARLVEGMREIASAAKPYLTGELVHYLAKCKTNIHKSAWGFQMNAFFDRELPDVSVALDPIIELHAVEQAIEHIRMVTNAAIYHESIRQSRCMLAVQQSEIMLPQHVKVSKYVNILTNPALLDAWLSGFTKARDAKQQLKGNNMKKVKEAGLDYNTIVDAAWKRIHP